jgi:hypothetical protein
MSMATTVLGYVFCFRVLGTFAYGISSAVARSCTERFAIAVCTTPLFVSANTEIKKPTSRNAIQAERHPPA